MWEVQSSQTDQPPYLQGCSLPGLVILRNKWITKYTKKISKGLIQKTRHRETGAFYFQHIYKKTNPFKQNLLDWMEWSVIQAGPRDGKNEIHPPWLSSKLVLHNYYWVLNNYVATICIGSQFSQKGKLFATWFVLLSCCKLSCALRAVMLLLLSVFKRRHTPTDKLIENIWVHNHSS